jgi:hypothetical protein
VRTLPPAPNLDYLKRQAKDVLAALREKDLGARLSDAQRSIAQLHGFRTWTELKAEVERLRKKPIIYDADVATALATAFDLGTPIEPALHIGTEVGGPIVRLVTSSGTYKAHAVLPSDEDDAFEEAIRLMDAAGAAGIKIPRAVRTAVSALVAEAGDHHWRVDTWIDLGPSIAHPVPSPIAFKAGALLARLHGLGLEPKGGMHPWLSATPRDAEAWQRILAKVEELDASWAPALGEAIPVLLDVSSGHAPAPTDGLVLSHTDFQPSSTHLDLDDELVPTGWEFAGAISPAWHLGMFLDAWTSTPSGEINEAAAKAIIDGYSSLTEVPPMEVSAFSPVITAWLNWLVSRMNWALGEDEDARSNAERELGHMLANPKDRRRFEHLLRAAGLG